MANGLNKHHILEAIDKLRSRKSRPDAFRIVSYVSKKYEFPKNDIKEYLESLSKDGTVLKVEFKGSFSYRNAANHRNSAVKTVSPTTEEESSKNHEPISDSVAGTLARLIVEEPDYLDVGISINELYDHIDSKVKKTVTKTYFKEILQKEVKNGNLVKFDNGNYCLGYPSGEHNSMSPSVSDVSQNSIDTGKEKSKSPIHSIRKYSCLSRHSSPSSSKNSTTSSTASSDKTSTSLGKPLPKTYVKSVKKAKGTVEEEVEKNEVSPSREGSRRKRFQKIVFDPSDSPKPKKIKEKKTNPVPTGKIRGPYKKHNKEVESPAAIEKPVKKLTPAIRHSTRNSNAEIKLEPIVTPMETKEEPVSDGESENETADTRNNCKICCFTIDFKSSRNMERWTSCHFCGKKAHVTCIEDTEQWTRFKLSKWQCNDCKRCVVCKKNKESNDAGLILCGLCDDAYHINCANIKKSKISQKWFCNKCSGVFNDEIKTEKEDFGSTEITSNESSQRTTPEPEDKKTPEKEERKEVATVHDNDEIDESIPDCSNWSCEEVYSYFLKYVLPEEASVFRDQFSYVFAEVEFSDVSSTLYATGILSNEVTRFLFTSLEIDGRVLLLLTRYDVLSDFKLKLGPALKIYAQVKKLQIRKNDPYLFWP